MVNFFLVGISRNNDAHYAHTGTCCIYCYMRAVCIRVAKGLTNSPDATIFFKFKCSVVLPNYFKSGDVLGGS